MQIKITPEQRAALKAEAKAQLVAIYEEAAAEAFADVVAASLHAATQTATAAPASSRAPAGASTQGTAATPAPRARKGHAAVTVDAVADYVSLHPGCKAGDIAGYLRVEAKSLRTTMAKAKADGRIQQGGKPKQGARYYPPGPLPKGHNA